MQEALAAKLLELHSQTDTVLALAYAGELNGDDFTEHLKHLNVIRREVLALIYEGIE